MTDDGRIVNEKDWRRNNLEIERKTREVEDELKRSRQKEMELKNNKYRSRINIFATMTKYFC